MTNKSEKKLDFTEMKEIIHFIANKKLFGSELLSSDWDRDEKFNKFAEACGLDRFVFKYELEKQKVIRISGDGVRLGETGLQLAQKLQ